MESLSQKSQLHDLFHHERKITLHINILPWFVYYNYGAISFDGSIKRGSTTIFVSYGIHIDEPETMTKGSAPQVNLSGIALISIDLFGKLSVVACILTTAGMCQPLFHFVSFIVLGNLQSLLIF